MSPSALWPRPVSGPGQPAPLGTRPPDPSADRHASPATLPRRVTAPASGSPTDARAHPPAIPDPQPEDHTPGTHTHMHRTSRTRPSHTTTPRVTHLTAGTAKHSGSRSDAHKRPVIHHRQIAPAAQRTAPQPRSEPLGPLNRTASPSPDPAAPSAQPPRSQDPPHLPTTDSRQAILFRPVLFSACRYPATAAASRAERSTDGTGDTLSGTKRWPVRQNVVCDGHHTCQVFRSVLSVWTAHLPYDVMVAFGGAPGVVVLPAPRCPPPLGADRER